MTLIQTAIALGAISLLTRSRWLELTAFGAAGVSIVIGVLAVLHVWRAFAIIRRSIPCRRFVAARVLPGWRNGRRSGLKIRR